MRTASTVARYVLGILFTIFGLNGLLEYANSSFIHQPPPTNPLALESSTQPYIHILRSSSSGCSS